MPSSTATESQLEAAALEWFAALGYEILEPDHLDPDSTQNERGSLDQVILTGRLRAALEHLNPDVPVDAIDEAMRRIQRHDAPTLIQNNLSFHRLLCDGIAVEVSRPGGGAKTEIVRLFDFESPGENDFAVVNQLPVVDRASGTGQERRPDVLAYVNGLPLGVLELKNPAAPNADVWNAYDQLQNYTRDIPSLFVTNCVLVISDDVHAHIGSLTAPDSRFAP
jgi:type I restriction enzyme R subunit